MTIESLKDYSGVADNTLLTDVAGTTGLAFARRSDSEDTVPPRVWSGAVYNQQSTGNGQHYYDASNLSGNAYTAKWTGFTGDSGSDFLSIFVRWNPANNSGIEFLWLRADNRMELRKFAPSFSSLANVSGGGSGLHANFVDLYMQCKADNTYTVWIRRQSDGFYWNPSTPGWQSGAALIYNNFADASSPITQVGKAGYGQRLAGWNTNVAGSTGATRMSRWEIDVDAGGGGAPAFPGSNIVRPTLSQVAKYGVSR